MKKIIVLILSLLLFSSCTVQTKYELIKDPSAVTEARWVDYLPIYSSHMPEPISTISDSKSLAELVVIINRATKSTVSRPMKIPEGDTPTFTNSLYIVGSKQDMTLIYIYNESDTIYLTDAGHLVTDKKIYELFVVQKRDTKRFNEIIKGTK